MVATCYLLDLLSQRLESESIMVKWGHGCKGPGRGNASEGCSIRCGTGARKRKLAKVETEIKNPLRASRFLEASEHYRSQPTIW